MIAYLGPAEILRDSRWQPIGLLLIGDRWNRSESGRWIDLQITGLFGQTVSFGVMIFNKLIDSFDDWLNSKFESLNLSVRISDGFVRVRLQSD